MFLHGFIGRALSPRLVIGINITCILCQSRQKVNLEMLEWLKHYKDYKSEHANE